GVLLQDRPCANQASRSQPVNKFIQWIYLLTSRYDFAHLHRCAFALGALSRIKPGAGSTMMSDAELRPDRAGRSAGEFTDLGRGTNQAGLRLYNERLVLSLIRRNGSLPKA